MRHVVALDVGTTTIRCQILDENGITVVSSAKKMELLYPEPGYVEIDPDELWDTILSVVKNALSEGEIEMESVACLGISTQRGSFTTWNSETGKHYHNFITWKDMRADSLVKEWNVSLSMKSIRAGSYFLYLLSRNKRFLAGSVLQFMNTQMTLRLVWALENVPGLMEAAINGEVLFGGVDSWLLYKLTGKHVTDVSSASATGLFDPFTMQWAEWLLRFFKIPRDMFPHVVDTIGDFGIISKDIFGVEIPICCSMADQAASLFGSGCLKPGDIKLTIGTGTFLNVNTGDKPHASITGLYPLVGWRIGSELVYIVEGAANDAGTLIEWMKFLDMIKQPSETSDLANSVSDTDGVYFVPSFNGLQGSVGDQTTAAGFLGVKPTTNRAQLVRSVLESVVFGIWFLYETFCEETRYSYNTVRVDGGVSRNDFMMQLFSDLSGLRVERSSSSEMSILGVAVLAGLQCGIWKNKEKVLEFRHVEKIFTSNEETVMRYRPVVFQWQKAVQRFGHWY